MLFNCRACLGRLPMRHCRSCMVLKYHDLSGDFVVLVVLVVPGGSAQETRTDMLVFVGSFLPLVVVFSLFASAGRHCRTVIAAVDIFISMYLGGFSCYLVCSCVVLLDLGVLNQSCCWVVLLESLDVHTVRSFSRRHCREIRVGSLRAVPTGENFLSPGLSS